MEKLPLQRTRSHGSMSIHRIRPNASGIDPSAALQIQYRTISIDVDDYNRINEGKSAKESQKAAATGLKR